MVSADFPAAIAPSDLGQILSGLAAEQLDRLDLSWGNLRSLPSGIGLLRSLRVLDLTGNCLTELPPELFELEALEELRLAVNDLTDLPPRWHSFVDCGSSMCPTTRWAAFRKPSLGWSRSQI
jgi:hypothetical protein